MAAARIAAGVRGVGIAGGASGLGGGLSPSTARSIPRAHNAHQCPLCMAALCGAHGIVLG